MDAIAELTRAIGVNGMLLLFFAFAVYTLFMTWLRSSEADQKAQIERERVDTLTRQQFLEMTQAQAVELTTLKSALAKMRIELSALEEKAAQIPALQDEIKTLRARLEEVEAEATREKQRADDAEKLVRELRQEIDTLKQKLKAADERGNDHVSGN